MLAAGHRRVHNRLYASSGYVVGAVMRRVLRRRHRSRLARETRSKYTDGTCTSIGFALQSILWEHRMRSVRCTVRHTREVTQYISPQYVFDYFAAAK